MLRLASPLLISLSLLGCKGDKSSTDDTGSGTDDTADPTDDTGSPEEWPYEEGCISLASTAAGTFASIEDALSAATEGDTIDLTLCTGEMAVSATLEIDRALTIEGRGSETNTLTSSSGPVIAIVADGVSISGLTLLAPASTALEIANTDDVSLTDIIITDPGDWGIAAQNADTLTLDQVVISGAVTGAVYLEKGSATFQDVSIVDNTGFGLYASSSDVDIIGSEISRTTWTNPSNPGDGLGVLSTSGSVVTLDGTVLSDNDFMNVYANTDSTTAISNATLTGSLYSVYSNEGIVSITDSEIIDGYNHGLYIFSNDPVTISGMTLSGDPKNTEEMLDEDWSQDGYYYGTGGLIVADDITITDSTITGYNDCGLLLAEQTSDAGAATLERVSFVDNRRRGLYTLIDTTAVDVSVSGIIEAEDQAFTDGGPCSDAGNYVGVLVGSSALDWTGGSITDNEGYGISALYGDITLTGLTASGNRCSSLLNYQGSVNISQTAFSSPGIGTDFSASVVDYYSISTTITDSSFSDSQTSYDDVYSSNIGGSSHDYIYAETGGMDIWSFYGGGLTVDNTSFSTGVQGLYLYETPTSVSNSSFSGYRQVIYTSGGSLTITDSTVDTFTDEGIYCTSGELDVEDTTFASGGSETVPYEYYINGSLADTGTVEYVAYGMKLYSCTAHVQDVSFTDLDGQAIYVSDYYEGDYEISNLTVDNVGAATTSHSAIYLYNYSYSYPTTVWMSSVSITDANAGSGLSAIATSYGQMSLEITGLSVNGAAGNGVTLSGDTLTASIQYADITNADNLGLSSTDAATTFSSSTIDASGASGAELLSGEGLTFSNNTITGSGGYGLICGDVDITDCSDNTYDKNTSGDTQGCPTACDE